MSPKYKLTKANIWPILKVLLWSAGSAVVVSLIAILENAEIPAEYTFLVPIVNTLLYTAKEFFSRK